MPQSPDYDSYTKRVARETKDKSRGAAMQRVERNLEAEQRLQVGGESKRTMRYIRQADKAAARRSDRGLNYSPEATVALSRRAKRGGKRQ